MNQIHFTKMHGAGNDYIYVDAHKYPISDPKLVAQKWSAPHTGIGSDGLILIEDSDVADFKMRMFNNDGSEGLMCGNGVRCIGKYVYDHQLTRSKHLSIETKAGIKLLTLYTDENDLVNSATVDMGAPMLEQREQMNTESGGMTEGTVHTELKSYCGTFVSMGNPHFVIFVDDIKSVDLEKEGAMLECNPIFPQKCNIEFAEMTEEGVFRTRVWERGSGITQACGTGACATAVAATICGKADHKATIVMDGGELKVEWEKENNHVLLTGPAVTVFEGDIII